jgi:hypothetical protein
VLCDVRERADIPASAAVIDAAEKSLAAIGVVPIAVSIARLAEHRAATVDALRSTATVRVRHLACVPTTSTVHEVALEVRLAIEPVSVAVREALFVATVDGAAHTALASCFGACPTARATVFQTIEPLFAAVVRVAITVGIAGDTSHGATLAGLTLHAGVRR